MTIQFNSAHNVKGNEALKMPIIALLWATSEVSVKTSIAHVKNSPEYNPDQPISDDHEVHLHNYYSEFVTNIE